MVDPAIVSKSPSSLTYLPLQHHWRATHEVEAGLRILKRTTVLTTLNIYLAYLLISSRPQIESTLV